MRATEIPVKRSHVWPSGACPVLGKGNRVRVGQRRPVVIPRNCDLRHEYGAGAESARENLLLLLLVAAAPAPAPAAPAAAGAYSLSPPLSPSLSLSWRGFSHRKGARPRQMDGRMDGWSHRIQQK